MPPAGLRTVVDRLRTAAARRAAAHHTCGDLLEQFVRRRDEAAFAELVCRHGPRVYAVCRRVLGQHQLAEDAYQATFVVLARKAHAVRPRSAVGGFLYGVARRAALEAYAVSRRRKETLVGRVPETPAAAGTAVESDVLAMLDEEIANLSDPLRAAVVLCELDGVGRTDAARQLGVAEGTLSSRLAAARKQLAARLTKRGVTFSAALFAAVAESARAAPPVELATVLPPTVSAIASGVLRTMILAKLKAVATVGVLLTAFVAWSLAPLAVPAAAAAPVPKEKTDDGLIWIYNPRPGQAATLTAFTPAGEKVRELALPDGPHYRQMTPDGRVAFVGKNGKRAGPADTDGLTIHLRVVSDKAEGTDTGIPAVAGCTYPVWSADMRRAAFGRYTPQDPLAYQYAVYDLAAKTETKLDLPADHRVSQWSADGTWLLVFQEHTMVWKRYTLADGKLFTFIDKPYYPYHFVDLSPDGKALLGFGRPGHNRTPWELDRFDVETGAVQKLEKFAQTSDDNIMIARWSPDSTRIACAVRERTAAGQEGLRVVVCDADGGNEVKLTGSRGQFMGTIRWLPNRHMIAAPPPKAKPPEGSLVVSSFVKDKALQILKPDGTVVRTVAPESRFKPWNIRTSPDGRYVAFLDLEKTSDPRKLEKWTKHCVRVLGLHSETFTVKTLVDDAYGPSVAWAPDGGLYVSAIDPDKYAEADTKGNTVPFRTWLYNPATGARQPVALPADYGVCDVSPDGKMLLTVSGTVGTHGTHETSIHLVPLATMKPQAVRPPTAVGSSVLPRFSPDGKHVLGVGSFLKPADPKATGLYVYDVATQTESRVGLPDAIAKTGYFDRFVAWSPDGKRIAFHWKEEIPMPAKPRRFHVAGPEDGPVKWHATRLTVCDADGGNAITVVTAGDDDEVSGLDWADVPDPPAKPKGDAPPPNQTEGKLLLWNEGEPILLNPDGTGEVRLPAPPQWKTRRTLPDSNSGEATISPDGQRVLVWLRKSGRDAHTLHVRSLFADGMGDPLPTSKPSGGPASWTAGGAKVRGLDWEYGVATQKSQPAVRLRQHPYEMSSDGGWLLTCKPEPNVTSQAQYLFLVSVDGTERKLGSDLPPTITAVYRFSPDGTRILFAGDHRRETPEGKYRPTELYTVGHDGANLRRLELKGVDDLLTILSCCWSPDGKQVAVVWVKRGFDLAGSGLDLSASYLTVADANGTNAKTIRTVKNRFLGHVDWANVPTSSFPKRAP